MVSEDNSMLIALRAFHPFQIMLVQKEINDLFLLFSSMLCNGLQRLYIYFLDCFPVCGLNWMLNTHKSLHSSPRVPDEGNLPDERAWPQLYFDRAILGQRVVGSTTCVGVSLKLLAFIRRSWAMHWLVSEEGEQIILQRDAFILSLH